MMLQAHSNPPPVLPVKRPRQRKPTAAPTSTLAIDPRTKRQHPDLMIEISRLVKDNDVQSMIALYEAFSDTARAVQAVKNQPRAGGIDDFLSLQFEVAISKAELVVFHLPKMEIGNDQAGEAGRVIVDCAMKMGADIHKVMALVSGACWAQGHK